MIFPREEKLSELISKKHNNMIKIVTGVRRCGKSYLLNEIFRKHLLSEGIDEQHIIRFAFDFGEDIDLLDQYYPNEPTRIHLKGTKNDYVINAKKFRAYVKDKTSEEGQYYLLLDEVQKLELFAETLNGFLHYSNFDVYVTGSNSKFLSSEIATEFRGRGDLISLQPLTFAEVYSATGGDKSLVLDEYLRYGGLPLCVLANDDHNKEEYLKNAYYTIYAKDIIDRKRIKNEIEFKEMVEVIASSIGALTNPEKIARTFKSREDSNIAHDTIKKYLYFLEDAFVLKSSKRYNIKGRKYIAAPSKYYFTDLGIRNAVLSFRQFEKTHLMENLIYNELVYRGFQVDVGAVEINEKNSNGNYSKKNLEVDFVANKGSLRYYIQSAFSIEDDDKRAQEERSLKEIDDSFKKIIITFDT
ncbi:MAG: ATP-binding protein, partial [Clostridia bacterium]|nr:ATP-binding protein [Clostridia bacterium]